jgi:putative DNA primase/helicase
MALRVACGMEWQGRRVRAGGVVFGATEAGLSARGRVDAWRRFHEVNEAPFAIYTAPVNLLEPISVDAFVVAIRAAKVKFGSIALVVLDTLSRAMPGADENKAEAMTAAIGACDTIRSETGAALLIVHHLGKDVNRGPRGHSSLFAAVDVEMRTENKTITVAKARDTVAGAQFPFRLQVVELGADIDGDLVTACVALPDEVRTATATAASKGKKKLIKGQAGLALTALRRAVAEAGQMPPFDVPASVKAVSIELWREYFYRDTPWDAGTTQGAKKKAFQRVRTDLLNGEHVVCRNEWVWPC